jgi:uncharacterized protein (TIGR02996 family)
VTRYRSEDAVEDGLLDAIRRAPTDEHARSVYRDWLEQHGHTDRLAFLQDEAVGELFVAPADAAWRAVVASPPIRNCGRACGGRWGQLEPTGHDLGRRCSSCALVVVYCTAIQWPTTPFVADAAVARDFDRRPDVIPMPTMNPPPPRQSLPPAVVLPPAKPGAFVRIRDWFRKR